MASCAPEYESGGVYKAFALPPATHDVRNDDDTQSIAQDVIRTRSRNWWPCTSKSCVR